MKSFNYKINKKSGFTPTLIFFSNKFEKWFSSVFSKNTSESVFPSNLFKTKRKLVSGFTLVETLIAITVLISAIVGPMVIVQKSLSSANFSKDQITAFYLAQEAIEYIRNKRDENTLSGLSWTNGLSDCIGKKCAVDAVNETLSQCSDNCPNLLFDTTNSFYGYNPDWKNSKFNRSIEIKNVNSDELSVNVIISWKSGVFMKNFSVRENIFNWQ